MGRIFVTGDTHGYENLDKLIEKNFPLQKELTKEDYVIICGDAGFLFAHDMLDELILSWLATRPFTTLFIDGNHEHFPKLNSYPITQWNGGNVHKINDSVYHLMRGQVFNIYGKTFLTIGGGDSIDKHRRKEGVSWFREELPTYHDCLSYNKKLDEINWNVDYVITHCIGDNIEYRINPEFCLTPNILTNYFFSIDSDLSFKHWYFGHYHIDKQIDDKHTCMFNKIIELI